jgi:hypothetical protein
MSDNYNTSAIQIKLIEVATKLADNRTTSTTDREKTYQAWIKNFDEAYKAISKTVWGESADSPPVSY